MFTETKRIPRYKEDRRAATACSIATGDELPVAAKPKEFLLCISMKRKHGDSAVPVRRPSFAQDGRAFARIQRVHKQIATRLVSVTV